MIFASSGPRPNSNFEKAPLAAVLFDTAAASPLRRPIGQQYPVGRDGRKHLSLQHDSYSSYGFDKYEFDCFPFLGQGLADTGQNPSDRDIRSARRRRGRPAHARPSPTAGDSPAIAGHFRARTSTWVQPPGFHWQRRLGRRPSVSASFSSVPRCLA
jgi:hypothetical protein